MTRRAKRPVAGLPSGACSSCPARCSAAGRSASTRTSSRRIARQIAEVVRPGVQVAVVIGGGNFFRGAELSQRGMDRDRADYMGMLGTVMNCLALQDFLEKARHPDPGADRDHDGPGRRALHPAARRAAPGEGPRRDLRRRRRHAVLLHRHRRRPARAGDRLPGAADGQERRRRRLRRRPADPSRRGPSSTRSATTRCSARAEGRRRDRVQPVQGQRHADHRVRPGRRQHRPGRAG